MESSVMLGSIPFLFYTTALRRFFAMAMHRAIGVCRCGAVFAMGMAIRRGWQPPKGGCVIIAPGWLAYLGSVEE